MGFYSKGDVESAFISGRSLKRGNSQTDGRVLLLFNNRIAEWRGDGLYITNCGWKTATTKAHLNLLPNVSIHQSKWVWYLNGKQWDGGWTKVMDSKPPAISGRRAVMFDETKRWVKHNAWRGHEEPVYAVCGANDTGSSSDSPCPSHVRIKELEDAAKALNGIPYKYIGCQTSNVFCTGVFLIVPPDRIDEARRLFSTYYETAKHSTRLLYPVTPEEKEETAEDRTKTVAMVSSFVDILTDDTGEKNKWKKRMMEAGLPGISFPDDWDVLSEEEKEKRLNAVINEMKK